MNDETIRYYDTHAEEFVAGTENADISACRDRFLQYLKPGQKILDAGCGSGRDVIAFKNEGYEVEAFDASEELCRIAAEKTGIPIKQQRFEELEGVESYDGIWACASLLHVRLHDLPDVLQRLYKLLRRKGTLYASFKYGSGELEKAGRYFCNLNEETCQKLLTDAGFSIREMFVTQDVRNDRQQEKWINVIVGKTVEDL